MKSNRILSAFVLFLVLFLVGCDTTTTTTKTGLDYTDFYSQIVFDKYTQLNVSDEPYYLYYYGPECYHCNLIKSEVLGILSNLQVDQVYLVETNTLSDVMDGISVQYTPSLVYVVDHQVVAIYENKTDVLAELHKLS